MNRDEESKNDWTEARDRLAEDSGLAIVIVDENSYALSKSNNNSMCGVLYNSAEFAPACGEYCGKAFQWATEAGKAVGYKCYAGLNCLAVPVKMKEKQLVAIVGRTFLKAEDYRLATERAVEGDWQKFSPDELFGNVLLSNSAKILENVAGKIKDAAPGYAGTQHRQTPVAANGFFQKENPIEDKKAGNEEDKQISEIFPDEKKENHETDVESEKNEARRRGGEKQNTISEINSNLQVRNLQSDWRSLFGSMLDLSYRQACLAILQFVSNRYSIADLAWLERREDKFEMMFAIGKLTNEPIEIEMAADDERLIDSLKNETSLELREQQSDQDETEPQTIELFPISVGGDIRSGLIVGEAIADRKIKRRIARFCQSLASQMEILRLREQLSRRGWLERAVEKFNENLRNIDSEDFWSSLTRTFAELMRAERSSLLLFDEKSNTFKAKAAIGARADFISRETKNLGERVAQAVLQNDEPVIVKDVKRIGLPAAPPEWNYKTDSFISYPITVGKRKIGVLNIADKADGDFYNESDLEFLKSIMPQIAVMIDRANLKNQAGEFEQLSITDTLTGLLNRRYLDERLTEEIKRSNRHGFPMSFLMIDVDKFKQYNDTFGHLEGDKALKIVAQCLKEVLRDEDIAVRYGGEEFSILLPQTNSFEAAIIAERVREYVESTAFPNRQVTISIGSASYSERNNTVEKLIKAADDALYEAKRAGRNVVKVFENLEADQVVQ